MDCVELKNNIIAFREGALSEDILQSCRQHVASCSTCSRLNSEFKKLEEIIELEKAAMPNPFAATRILQHLDNEIRWPAKAPSSGWIRVLQPVAIAIALVCGILIGSYTAKKDTVQESQLVNNSENIEFLKANLFISEFADEDRNLILNK
jgi:anti-sigma factor RsiW